MSKGLSRSDIHELLDKLTKDEMQRLLDLIAEDIADILANTRDKGHVVYKQPTTKSEEYLNKLRGA